VPPSAATAAKRPAARRAGATRVHRRVSGPGRPARQPPAAVVLPIPRRLRVVPPALGPFAERAMGAARTVRDSNAVDRLVRGRIWIGLLGVLLIALVFLNVSLLKLNAAAGRNAEWAKKLRVENADLRARVSRLHSAAQIQAEGRKLGLVMPAAADVHYLIANPARDAIRAAHRQSLVAPWSTSDLVSASPDPATAAPVAPVAQTAAPATGTTGAQAPSGVTGTTAPTANPPGGVAPSGTTGQAQTGTSAATPSQTGTGAATP
jgi:hypothetical protein